jgi:hypothetical protein
VSLSALGICHAAKAEANQDRLEDYWQPAADVAIDKGRRHYVSTVVYSVTDIVGPEAFAVHVQPRTSVGTVSPFDCPTNHLSLGAPIGTTALSRPVIAVNRMNNQAVVVVTARIGATWQLFAKWHWSTDPQTCQGWSLQWEPLSTTGTNGLSGTQTFTGAPAAAFAPDGYLYVQVKNGTSYGIECSSSGPGTANWSQWRLFALTHCGSAAGGFRGVPTTIQAGQNRVTVWPQAGGNPVNVALIVRDANSPNPLQNDKVLLYRAQSNGGFELFSASTCAAVVAETFSPNPPVWLAKWNK